MNKTITYGIDGDTGMVCSRVNDKVAWPILQWDKMLPENNFAALYELESMSVYTLGSTYQQIKWTKKIPTDLKNRHRTFWGFKPLSESRTLTGKHSVR